MPYTSGSASKRKINDVVHSSDRIDEPHASSEKKAKLWHLNTEFPDDLRFIETKFPGRLRLMTWNVCSVSPKGQGGPKPEMIRYIKTEDADVVGLTEIKSCPEDFMSDHYRYRYFSRSTMKPNTNGVAVFSKFKPLSVQNNFKHNRTETRGRFLSLEFDQAFVIVVYVPNSGAGGKSLPAKLAFNKDLGEYFDSIRSKDKKIIWMGDVNCMLSEKDWHKAALMHSKESGRTPEEQNSLRQLMNPSSGEGFIDIWRCRHPDATFVFTYYGPQSRQRGTGQRLDLILIPESLEDKVTACHIRRRIWADKLSDHVPVMCDIDFKLST